MFHQYPLWILLWLLKFHMNVLDGRQHPGFTSQIGLARQRKTMPAETLQHLLVRITWNVEIMSMDSMRRILHGTPSQAIKLM